MIDLSCLAKNYVVETDQRITGINANEIFVGGTGSGKTVSSVEPRVLHTYNSSIVVPLVKKSIRDKTTSMLRKRGYAVWCIDFTKPEKSTIGYDPIDFVRTEEDVVDLARRLVGTEEHVSRNGGSLDPYWDNSAASVISALINLEMLRARKERRNKSFKNVIDTYYSLEYNQNDDCFSSNLDGVFARMGREFPGNQATRQWKTIQGLSLKTASCILSTVNNALDKVFSPNILSLMQKPNRVSFERLGKEKTALFLVTSPINKAQKNYVNILYGDLFQQLFASAENNETGRLDVPVHIICDDFACGSRIDHFEEYISVFRSAGISVTLLLQSETQLTSMYGEYAATTIINNCDTYVYMGGMDMNTSKRISEKCDVSIHSVMNMKIGEVIVFRRGEKPLRTLRYQTLDDPLYKEYIHTPDQKDKT